MGRRLSQILRSTTSEGRGALEGQLRSLGGWQVGVCGGDPGEWLVGTRGHRVWNMKGYHQGHLLVI